MTDKPDAPTKEFIFGDAYEGDSKILVWCDGRDYDPKDELYSPVYSYSIVTPHWRYDSNDIRGAGNEIPSLDRAAQSLFAFLIACAEAKDDSSDNFTLFPSEVRDWAQHFSDELQIEYEHINRTNKAETDK